MILVARPKPIIQGIDPIFRGGCLSYHGENFRSAYRLFGSKMARDYNLGFRIILRKRVGK